MPDSPSLDQSRVCASCGAQLKPDASFCTACGTAIGATPSKNKAQPQPATSQPRRSSPWLWVAVIGVFVLAGLLTVLLLNRQAPAKPLPSTSQPPAAAQQDIPYPAVPRISPADAKARLDSGQAVVVDVRDVESYQAAHIDGAVSIPLSELGSRMQELPKNAEIITYCT